MIAYKEIRIRHELFFLLPLKGLFRPLQRQLVLSDIHLGKASHFRKKGIAMPAQSHLKDIDRIHYLIESLNPETVLLLGDLFHSDYNQEWLWFKSILRSYPHVQFVLVEGNHDILPRGTYKIENLLKIGLLEEQHVIFSHHPIEQSPKLNICGHLHPGIRIRGKAKQSVSLPCFVWGPDHFILPAFGDLTGMHLLEKEKNTRYFAVTNDTVVEL